MGIAHLIKYSKLKHFSGFSLESIITDFGMYESAIIDMRPIISIERPNNSRVEVGLDMKQLHSFYSSKNPLLLPCPFCKMKMSFLPCICGNPRCLEDMDVEKRVGRISLRKPATNLNDYGGVNNKSDLVIQYPKYFFGNDILIHLNENDIELLKDKNKKAYTEFLCALECRKYLLDNASEVRRDFICSMNSSHRIFVNFRIYSPIDEQDTKEYNEQIGIEENDATRAYDYLKDKLLIQKVGQYPSLADMQMFDVEKYRKMLGNESYRDLTRAIGLNADGIGAGAFLYLRRVLERLVEEAHQEAKKCSQWDEESYNAARFVEKLKILAESGFAIIPEDLKNVKSKFYGVLSQGIHESTDNECRELFPYMQFAIERILDEKIAAREKEERIRQLNIKLN